MKKVEEEKKTEESEAAPGKAIENAPKANDLFRSTEGTGIEFIEFLDVSPEISSLSLTATTSTTLGDLYRYPPKKREWVKMLNKEAYFRDVFVGQKISIYNAVDGDEWTCEAILPDGSVKQWGATRFYSSYGGQSNCFVSPSGWSICGTRNISILWYITAQCAPTGTWTFMFYHNGSFLFSDQFELFPQIPPYLKYPNPPDPDSVRPYAQINYSDTYDHINKTIADVGCALTSAAMVLTYHGFSVNPSELNNFLKNYQAWDKTGKVSYPGYSKGGGVNWKIALDAYSNGEVKYYGRERKHWRQIITFPGADGRLEKDICTYGPQIMRLTPWFFGTHFVVATGRDRNKTTWLINDSYNGATDIEINNTKWWWPSDYQDYRKCVGPEYTYVDSWCSLKITFHSPGELVITDPLGRKEGYDPVSETLYYDQISNAAYGDDGLPNYETGQTESEAKEIDIQVPAEGEYELKVIGTGVGDYALEIIASDREGGFSYKGIEQIPISPGIIHTYILNYSRKAGSEIEVCGVFDGKGQRPRDVNKFLSFSNPTQVTTELPQGITTFDLFIFYDQPIIPETFKAELNRQDITSLFSPSPGGAETVRLNLASGRNTLVLSVDGLLASGRQATDSDRLVFIVP